MLKLWTTNLELDTTHARLNKQNSGRNPLDVAQMVSLIGTLRRV